LLEDDTIVSDVTGSALFSLSVRSLVSLFSSLASTAAARCSLSLALSLVHELNFTARQGWPGCVQVLLEDDTIVSV
jgi:hypothetical protein